MFIKYFSTIIFQLQLSNLNFKQTLNVVEYILIIAVCLSVHLLTNR